MNHTFYLVLPPLFYGVAVQQMLELLYSFLPQGHWQRYQKPISKALAVLIGSMARAVAMGFHGIALLPQFDELLLSGLLTAASAETTNALIKWLVYAKEARKAAAAEALSSTGSISLADVSRK